MTVAMTMDNTHKATQNFDKEAISNWFVDLRDRICDAFEAIEREFSHEQISETPGQFTRTNWDRPGGGAGEMSVMRGRVFEKVGVNFSCVHGKLTPEFRKKLPHTEKCDSFWASGVSLVAHMHSPHVPAVHFNTRCIATDKHWWGGGMDLTPTFPTDEITNFFHSQIKAACDKHDEAYYPKFKDWCDTYFYLSHREEPRGVGGIFFDYHNTDNFAADFAFVKDVGTGFLDAYLPVVHKTVSQTWNSDERKALCKKRGRYAEFNLLHDRGTRFGLETQGNIEAILMSLPPEAHW